MEAFGVMISKIQKVVKAKQLVKNTLTMSNCNRYLCLLSIL